MNNTDLRPVYIRLIDDIYMRILTGEYPPGSKLPTVRDLALTMCANPNTVQRALGRIEEKGLIYTQRTTGKYVTENTSVINEARRSLAEQYADEYFENMKRIGFGSEEASSFIREKEDQNGTT
ncbi:MAG: GntR family transcriptional regulator [Clostridia bacterium]|nr:GntR family transcriptional regulator [Clostridia bacterium]MBQ3869139.1 GntR family transcriptional regulator [Clostridia bacterium]